MGSAATVTTAREDARALLSCLLSTMRGRAAVALVLALIAALVGAAFVSVRDLVLQVIGLEAGTGWHLGVAAGVEQAFGTVGLEPSLWPVLAVYVAVGLLLAVLRRLQSVHTGPALSRLRRPPPDQPVSTIADSSWLALSRTRSSDLVHVLTSEVDRVTQAPSSSWPSCRPPW